jgi:hypothetical protein
LGCIVVVIVIGVAVRLAWAYWILSFVADVARRARDASVGAIQEVSIAADREAVLEAIGVLTVNVEAIMSGLRGDYSKAEEEADNKTFE